MTHFTRRDLPADIAVFGGTFASQPLVFAHLLDVAPELELEHVEVIQSGHQARLEARFDGPVARDLAGRAQTIVLILPAAFSGMACPVTQTRHLTALGVHRGTVPHLSVQS